MLGTDSMRVSILLFNRDNSEVAFLYLAEKFSYSVFLISYDLPQFLQEYQLEMLG